MKYIKYLLAITLLSLLNVTTFAQSIYHFEKGFNPQEADDMMVLNEGFADTTKSRKYKTALADYKFQHRSRPIGFDNAWDLWLRTDSTVVLTFRGTTTEQSSQLVNTYCAMLPANGEIRLNDSTLFTYKLANHPRAAVHGGFLAAFAFTAVDSKLAIDTLYAKGYRNFLISGHSQGGSIAYLYTSWLHYLIQDGKYPEMRIKCITIASPKVGNSYYTYDFDNCMRAEWAFTIINANDAVPEVPFTTQQLLVDINEPNPLLSLKQGLKTMPLFQRWAINFAFNSMRKKASKSAKSYRTYLGKYTGKMLRGYANGLILPAPVETTNYTRPGTSITLMPDAGYETLSKEGGFGFNHLFTAYRYLLKKQYPNQIW